MNIDTDVLHQIGLQLNIESKNVIKNYYPIKNHKFGMCTNELHLKIK